MVLGEVNSAITLFERLARLLKRRRAQVVTSVAQRFVELFEAHGVRRNQIPRLVGHGLALSDVVDDASLLPKLTEPVLDAACSLFGVQRGWLDGVTDEPYVRHDFYKSPADFQRFIDGLKGANPGVGLNGYLIVPEKTTPRDPALLILAEAVAVLGDATIYRYHVCDTWMYGYWKARAYLTACVAIAWRNKVYVTGRYADRRDLAALAAGQTLPGRVLDFLAKRWYAEDLALLPDLYLRDVDPEVNNYGVTSALALWLRLDEEGWMDTGLGQEVRPAFEARFEGVGP